MYTIKEASSRSGVGVPLLRAWERRYGVVVPTRTPSGYRLYDDDAIRRLRAMRELIGSGWSAQQAADRVRGMDAAELEASSSLPARPGLAPSPSGGAVDRDAAVDLVERLVSAATDLDSAALEAALDDAFGSARFESAAERVVMPALRAIGDGWARQEISVAGEHAASHAILRRLAMAFEAAGDSAAGRPILVGLGSGGRHELGALAFATAARRAGLRVLYLGPDLPPESWTSAATSRQAGAAVVGVPTRSDVARARDVLDALRKLPGEIVLAAGGEEAHRLSGEPGLIVLERDLHVAVETLRAALGVATPGGRGRRRS